MKKLIILMLVLGMAAGANAAIKLSLNGDTNVETYEMPISSTVVIDVYSDTANEAYGCYVGIANNSTGGEWTGVNTKYAAAGNTAKIEVYDAWWWYAEANTSNPDTSPILAGTHFDFEYHCLGPMNEWVDIQLTDFGGALVDTIRIHQVPEPVSMLLLGLGGLLLRRRK